MSDLQSYAQAEAAIRAHNQLIIDGFESSLEEESLSRTTIRHHVSHVTLLAEYLISHELKTLDESNSAHLSWVLQHWYPNKVQRLSLHGKAAQAAGLKKFYRWMGATGRLDSTSVTASLAFLANFPAPKLRRGTRPPSR